MTHWPGSKKAPRPRAWPSTRRRWRPTNPCQTRLPLSNQTKPPGWVDRFLYLRGPRNGPQQKRMLSESTLARLGYEGKGEGFRAYKPETLMVVWPREGT